MSFLSASPGPSWVHLVFLETYPTLFRSFLFFFLFSCYSFPWYSFVSTGISLPPLLPPSSFSPPILPDSPLPPYCYSGVVLQEKFTTVPFCSSDLNLGFPMRVLDLETEWSKKTIWVVSSLWCDSIGGLALSPPPSEDTNQHPCLPSPSHVGPSGLILLFPTSETSFPASHSSCVTCWLAPSEFSVFVSWFLKVYFSWHWSLFDIVYPCNNLAKVSFSL